MRGHPQTHSLDRVLFSEKVINKIFTVFKVFIEAIFFVFAKNCFKVVLFVSNLMMLRLANGS